MKFASKESELLVNYISEHPDVTDVLFTGGDPLTMNARILGAYIKPLLEANISHLRHIRIGTKTLTYWPFRYIADSDTEDLLALFKQIGDAGKHLAVMAHFNHPVELEGDIVKNAIKRIIATGAVIRTQSPVIKHINDSPEIWADMLRKEVALGCIPYYMFVARNTGAQHFFSVTLEDAWKIFRGMYQRVSGICRTIRGPVMSCLPGKVQILGIAEVRKEKIMVFRMIQGRNPDWVARPFFAEYNPEAIWHDDLKPAFGDDKFFFEDELNKLLKTDREREDDDFE